MIVGGLSDNITLVRLPRADSEYVGFVQIYDEKSGERIY